MHDLVAAEGVAVDVAEVFALLGVGGRGLQQFGKPDDGRQGIVELVRDARDELADGGKFFALDQLGLRGS
ncbi:MAG: hypothetical protein WDM96_16190 [Lacunisphaera sp.]